MIQNTLIALFEGSEGSDTFASASFEALVGELDDTHNAAPSLVLWKPRSGNTKARFDLALEMQEGVINRLPESERSMPVYGSMNENHVRWRIRELFGHEGRAIQIETVWMVGCRMRSMILIAKTGIGKSLIFEAIPLLDPSQPGIALVVMPLKKIQSQQVEKVNRIEGARAVVYDGEHRDQMLRYRIAAGHYTHSKNIRNAPSHIPNNK